MKVTQCPMSHNHDKKSQNYLRKENATKSREYGSELAGAGAAASE